MTRPDTSGQPGDDDYVGGARDPNPSQRRMVQLLFHRLRELDMSQADFARLVGTQRQYVHDVLIGRRRKANLDVWAAKLGMHFVITPGHIHTELDRPDEIKDQA